MTRRIAVVAAMLVCMVVTPAFARHHNVRAVHSARTIIVCDHQGCRPAEQVASRMPATKYTSTRRAHSISNPMGSPRFRIEASADPRPHAWCGWWMRHHLGVADKRYNLARNWAHYGTPAPGPEIGAIVVWRTHVGIITGATSTGWVVKSGNDDHAVRERERPLRGAIAFRRPNGVALR